MKALFFSLLVAGLIAGCAGPTTLKSPCVGAGGSPCDRTPLSSGATA